LTAVVRDGCIMQSSKRRSSQRFTKLAPVRRHAQLRIRLPQRGQQRLGRRGRAGRARRAAKHRAAQRVLCARRQRGGARRGGRAAAARALRAGRGRQRMQRGRARLCTAWAGVG